MDDDCPFCAIAAGESAAHVVFEDDRTVAFLDENPAADGHTLVVPRAHRDDVVTGSDGSSGAIFDAVSAVVDTLDRTLEPDGFSVFHTSGSLVGTVSHAHVHVIPRYADDDIGISLVRDELDDEDGRALAERLRDAR